MKGFIIGMNVPVYTLTQCISAVSDCSIGTVLDGDKLKLEWGFLSWLLLQERRFSGYQLGLTGRNLANDHIL